MGAVTAATEALERAGFTPLEIHRVRGSAWGWLGTRSNQGPSDMGLCAGLSAELGAHAGSRDPRYSAERSPHPDTHRPAGGGLPSGSTRPGQPPQAPFRRCAPNTTRLLTNCHLQSPCCRSSSRLLPPLPSLRRSTAAALTLPPPPASCARTDRGWAERRRQRWVGTQAAQALRAASARCSKPYRSIAKAVIHALAGCGVNAGLAWNDAALTKTWELTPGQRNLAVRR